MMLNISAQPEYSGSLLRKRFSSTKGEWYDRIAHLESVGDVHDAESMIDSPGLSDVIKIFQMKVFGDSWLNCTFRELIYTNRSALDELNDLLIKEAILVDYSEVIAENSKYREFFQVAFVKQPVDVSVLQSYQPTFKDKVPHIVHVVKAKALEDLMEEIEKKSSFQAIVELDTDDREVVKLVGLETKTTGMPRRNFHYLMENVDSPARFN